MTKNDSETKANRAQKAGSIIRSVGWSFGFLLLFGLGIQFLKTYQMSVHIEHQKLQMMQEQQDILHQRMRQTHAPVMPKPDTAPIDLTSATETKVTQKDTAE